MNRLSTIVSLVLVASATAFSTQMTTMPGSTSFGLSRSLAFRPPVVRQCSRTKIPLHQAASQEAEPSGSEAEEEEPAEPAAGSEEAPTSKEVEDIPPPSGGDSDILNSPVFLKKKVDVLKSDLLKMDGEIAAAQKDLEEAKAEWGPMFDALNKEYAVIQERIRRENEQGGSEAASQVALGILPVLDDFDRGFAAIEPSTEEETKIEAEYKAVYDMLMEILTSSGIKPVQTLGHPFDYQYHQAVMSRPSDEYEEGIVMEELAKGYQIGDKLIRPAMVVVAA